MKIIRVCDTAQTLHFSNVEMGREAVCLVRQSAGFIGPSMSFCKSLPLDDGQSHLVIGFGNVLLRDDGAGVQLMHELHTSLGMGAASFVDGGTMSFSLLPYLQDAASILVIDAAELGSPPGTVRLYEGESMDRFLRIVRRRTVHEVGLIDLMDMARLTACLPERRALLCIQPEAIEWGSDLSPCVASALIPARQIALEVMQRWSKR
jgi:hydrogenase maturation protease